MPQIVEQLLRLRHPFGLSRDTVHELPTVLLEFNGGIGEAAPVRYLGDTALGLRRALAFLCENYLEYAAREGPDTAMLYIQSLDAPSAAKAAVDIAVWDRRARQHGLPMHMMLGHRPATGLHTSLTVALDTFEAMLQRTAEAVDLGAPCIKVKLGRDPDFDRRITSEIRRLAPATRLRVDANAGWSLAEAKHMCQHLANLGVELVEQPLAIGSATLDGPLAELCRISPVPIFLDEDIQGPQSLRELPDIGLAGINIKLMKCGGITPALEMFEQARLRGLQILLGCMIESRIGLSAAAALATAVDYLDLDAHLLTQNDPFTPDPASNNCPYTQLDTLVSRGLGLGLDL